MQNQKPPSTCVRGDDKLMIIYIIFVILKIDSKTLILIYNTTQKEVKVY